MDKFIFLLAAYLHRFSDISFSSELPRFLDTDLPIRQVPRFVVNVFVLSFSMNFTETFCVSPDYHVGFAINKTAHSALILLAGRRVETSILARLSPVRHWTLPKKPHR